MKTKKHIPLHIYDETYKVNFYVSYGVKSEEFKRAVKRILRLDKELENILENLGCGKCIEYKTDEGVILWIWTKYKNPWQLAHECFHGMCFVMDAIKMPLRSENDEAYAYLLESIMRRTLKTSKM